MKHFITLVALGTLLSSAACQEQVVLQASQEVYFELRSEQFAWNHYTGGFYVTKDGKVVQYRNPTDWKHIDEQTPAETVEKNLKSCTLTDITISPKELSEYSNLLPKISKATLGKPIQKGADQGNVQFYALRFHPDTKSYTAQLLGQRGDITINSTDSLANRISEWLMGIQYQLAEAQQKK